MRGAAWSGRVASAADSGLGKAAPALLSTTTNRPSGGTTAAGGRRGQRGSAAGSGVGVVPQRVMPLSVLVLVQVQVLVLVIPVVLNSAHLKRQHRPRRLIKVPRIAMPTSWFRSRAVSPPRR